MKNANQDFDGYEAIKKKKKAENQSGQVSRI